MSDGVISRKFIGSVEPEEEPADYVDQRGEFYDVFANALESHKVREARLEEIGGLKERTSNVRLRSVGGLPERGLYERDSWMRIKVIMINLIIGPTLWPLN